MNKVMKIAFAASVMLAISFTLGCSNDKDEKEKWCIVEIGTDVVSVEVKTTKCYKIGPTMYKNELLCKAAGEAPNTTSKVADPPEEKECDTYDDGSKK